MNARGQSELVGIMLLTAVVVIAMTMIGFLLFEDMQRSIAGEGPDVDIEGELNESNAIITHNGGDSLPFSDLELRLRSGGEERIYDLADPGDINTSVGDGDDSFEFGERVVVDHDFTGDVRILLVQTTDPGHILYDETVTIVRTGPKEKPTIEKFDLTDTSDNLNASFDVTWNASDIQGDITEVTTRLIDDGVVVDSATTSFGQVGVTGDHTDTLTNESGSGTSYKIELTVTDAAGNTAVDSKVANAGSEIGLRYPVIQQFDVKDLYQGNNVTYNITHNATDPDGDITELGVTLTHERSSSTEVDNVTYTFNQTGVTGETTDTLVDPTKRQKDELYRINISVRDAEGNVISDSVTDKADGDDVSIGTGADPVIETFNVTDLSCQPGNTAEYEIFWDVSDSDGNLNNVTLEMVRTDKTNPDDSTMIQISGSEASGTDTLSKNGGCGNNYNIRIIVKDVTGNSVTDSWEDTADGDGSN